MVLFLELDPILILIAYDLLGIKSFILLGSITKKNKNVNPFAVQRFAVFCGTIKSVKNKYVTILLSPMVSNGDINVGIVYNCGRNGY